MLQLYNECITTPIVPYSVAVWQLICFRKTIELEFVTKYHQTVVPRKPNQHIIPSSIASVDCLDQLGEVI
jgi:hypothetical protein